MNGSTDTCNDFPGFGEKNRIGGGQDRVDLVHALGKLTARERIAHILDEGSFEEIGSIVTDIRPPLDGEKEARPLGWCGDGVRKRTDGRPVALYVMDFTVMSGSLGNQTAWKMADITAMAGERGLPLIGVIDSAGERLSFKGGDAGMNGLARFLRTYCLYSGIIPRITLLLGPCTGVLSVVPGLSDFRSSIRIPGFCGSGVTYPRTMPGMRRFIWKNPASATCLPRVMWMPSRR